MSLEKLIVAWWNTRRPVSKSAMVFGAIYLVFLLLCWIGIMVLHNEASIIFIMPIILVNSPWMGLIRIIPHIGGLWGFMINDVVIPTLCWAGVGASFGLLFEVLNRRFAEQPPPQE